MSELLSCPFCGSHDVEVQGKPAILDALDSVCCNECSADAPYPVWNTRAQIPSQGGEAVEVVAYHGKDPDGGEGFVGARWPNAFGQECIVEPLMTVAQHNRIVAALTAPPLIDPALTNSQCACGDEYAANSYGAGFMAANNGVCENCDTYTAPPSPDAELVELKSLLPELDDALEDLELHGRHADQGYRKLKDWYRKIALITGRIDAKLASLTP